MSVTDLTFDELQTLTYYELKAPTTSEAYPTAWIKELLNEGYMDIFNQPKRSLYLREAQFETVTIPDTQLTSAVSVGDTTINVVSTSAYPSAGTFLLGPDFISYTGKTATTFTGCTNVNTAATTDVYVRFVYPLSTYTTTIEEQQIRSFTVDQTPFTYKPLSTFLSNVSDNTLRYSLFNGSFILPQSISVQKIAVDYFKKIVPMAVSSDTPTFLPNQFRKMLVFYATGRAMLADDKRTGWELYYNYNPEKPHKSSGLYFDWLRNLYAKYSRRIDTQRKRAGSIFD